MPTIHVKAHNRVFFVGDENFERAIRDLEKGRPIEDVRNYLEKNKERSPLVDSKIGYFDFDHIASGLPSIEGEYYKNTPLGKRICKTYSFRDFM